MEKETIIASFVYRVYFSEANGFSVCTYKEKTGKKTRNIKCIGTNLPQFKGIDYEMTGDWEKGRDGKDQFKVAAFSEHVEKERDSIIAFLSSGAIKGIGKKTAERIFDMYGTDSLEMIEKSPENLLRIRGITNAKLDKIIESYSKNHLPKDLIELLMPCGFTTNNIIKVHRIHRQDAISVIENNPYTLCDIHGITFMMCDRIARHYNMDPLSPIRLEAAIKAALKMNFFAGRVGATMKEILGTVRDIAAIWDTNVLRARVLKMVKTGLIDYKKVEIDGKVITYYYLIEIKRTEEKLAEEIIKNIGKKDKSEEAKKSLESTVGMKFDEAQKSAIINAFTYRLSIITGGPGTGKTTITKKIADINKAVYGEDPIFLAPTGKAARRITESTGIEAFTIHSYLNLRPTGDEDNSYDESEHVMIENKCVIIDEFSMVDMKLALMLFEHMSGCRIIIVGDPDQLQSVGAGNVLLDMISSERVPYIKLIYEHRQGEGSTIKKNANGMQNGQKGFTTSEDFICEYVRGNNLETTMQDIEDRMVAEYLRYFRSPKYESVVCLCPYKNYTAGMYSVNKRLQDVINPIREGQPEFKGLHEMVFHVGDPVMHVERNTEEISNGNTGIVKAIKKVDGDLTLFAEFDLGNKTVVVEYTNQNSSQLALAYAMTVHKSQGSEYDAVVTCLSKAHRMMIKRRIPYTAITRAKKSVSIYMDDEDTIMRAIENDSTEDRNTLLSYLLKTNTQKTSFVMMKEKKKKNGEIEGQLTLQFA